MLFKALRHSSLLGFADDLAFERFNGVLRVFDKLVHKTDSSRHRAKLRCCGAGDLLRSVVRAGRPTIVAGLLNFKPSL